MPGRPELSIVIPVFREAGTLAGCLRSLAASPGIERCEVLVVDGDNGSTGIPVAGLPVTRLVTLPGRGRQLNAGARAASAPALLFLHVDTLLPGDFVRRVTRALTRHPAGAFDLHIVTRHPLVRLVSIVGAMRSRLTRVPYGDQAQFVRKFVFDAVGGFPETPVMEDVGLMDRLKAAGHRITFVRPPAKTSDRRWKAEGAVRATLRNWRLLLAYRAGVPAAELARRYPPHSELKR